MYNGIGLATPRGSGTSGYIQRNLSFVRPKRSDFEASALDKTRKGDSGGPKIRKANSEILLHEKRRKIEGELLVLREELEKTKLNPAAIEDRISGRRAVLLAKLEGLSVGTNNEVDADKLDTHQSAELKNRELKNLRKAFRIDEDHKPGRAFDAEEMEKRKLERMHLRQQRELEERARKVKSAARKKKQERARERERERAHHEARSRKKRRRSPDTSSSSSSSDSSSSPDDATPARSSRPSESVSPRSKRSHHSNDKKDDRNPRRSDRDDRSSRRKEGARSS